MDQCQKIKPRWQNLPCFVAAPGPGLNEEIADTVRATGWPVLACQDAYRLMPWADVLYGCDARWWNAHNGTDFKGEKWSGHNNRDHADDKTAEAKKYGLNLVKGKDAPGFSTDPGVIHYGGNSGFQALNLAILFGSTYIVMVGYDMRVIGGKSHFFGDHPQGLLNRSEYESFVERFKEPPVGVTIVNATPGSAIDIYPKRTLRRAIDDYSLHWHGAVANA